MKVSTVYRIGLIGAGIVLTGYLTGCNLKKKKEAAEAVEASFAVNTYRTAEGNLDDYLEFGGDVVAASVVNVYPDTSGKLSRVRVAVGDYVKKDQVIAYLDPSRPGMNYAESPVKAPVAGTITSFPLTIGATCAPAAAVAQISSTGKLEIQTNIAERFISRIKNGQKASVSFDAYPGHRFNATVFEVSPVLDTSTRTMRIKLRVDSAESYLKAGMYARVQLITEQISNAIIVPYDAILTREDGNYVFIVNRTGGNADGAAGIPGTVSLRQVKTGIHVDDKAEIVSGLASGQEIVTRGQTLLTDGAKVNIIATVDGSAK